MTKKNTSVPKFRIELIADDVVIPQRVFPTDSGLDVTVYKFDSIYRNNEKLEEVNGKPVSEFDEIVLKPLDRVLVNSGFKCALAPGFDIQIRSRSSAFKYGLVVVNSPGTVDEQYRGVVGVALVNVSGVDYVIKKGDRVAQLVVCPVVYPEVEVVDRLDDTDRGERGWGSSGKDQPLK
ncbi:dUTP diphosphatase [Candidatus Dojkabacteria bacterium]|nr:dUTP diphosphatase [Candidatus Dojkabacteria bacterium]